MSRFTGRLSKAAKSAGSGIRKKTAASGSDFDTSVSKHFADGPKKRKVSPRARAWEMLSSQTSAERSATREVHDTQQLGRGEIGEMRTSTLPEVGSALIGALTLLATWIMWGVLGFAAAGLMAQSGSASEDTSGVISAEAALDLGVPPHYYITERPLGGIMVPCYQSVDPAGEYVGSCLNNQSEIVRPDWHIDMTWQAMLDNGMIDENGQRIVSDEGKGEAADTLGSWLLFGHVGWLRVLVSLGLAVGVWSIARTALMRQLERHNLMHDTEDINQHTSDARIALPNETIRNYGVFPDVGAHSPVQPSSMLSHVMLSNKGVDKVEAARRTEADIIDEDGELLYHKGEVLRGDDGEPLIEKVPMFDTDFSHALFDASGVPEERGLRKFFNPAKVEYNPGGANRDKFGDQDTIAEHINQEWELPVYEPQRPAGVYIVDEAPVNTMVLAMTRAGKGQTYIEPMIDMWLRESRPNNMVINDPKGELLVKHYVRASARGYQVVQFNLINALKTDIYNPLGLAAEAAREGDTTKCALYVENIAEVFFPVDGGDDPVWPNAANNAFKRTAYGLIDFYLEEERQMRKRAAAEDWDVKVLETRLDEMWGKVTLYNCYQFFVQLSAKKLKDPITRVQEKAKAGFYGDLETDVNAGALVEEAEKEAEKEMSLWDGNSELDMLTLFFNATDQLPQNTMRGLVGNADKALRAMGAAEKMLASVYGITITAMSFFTDPTISTLTSGTLSQNTDLGGMSFPRRMGVRFDANYVRRLNLVGTQVLWDAFEDAEFTRPLGKDFEHEDTVSREGWARYYFKGIFEQETSYLRLRLLNTSSGTLIKTFFFQFTKSYQTNLKGRTYVTDPVTEEKIVKNGVMVELLRERDEDGKVTGYKKGHTTFRQKRLNVQSLSMEEINRVTPEMIKQIDTSTHAVLQTSVRYAEKPKAVFLVTPPHLMKYAKLILILIKQLVDLNFDKSYMTKSTQKPLYKTRFMLDELGNLQSEGHGIAGFETMLSIGLGQEQQFTLILQTLQQLKDVYGDSVDKIVQGNAQPLHSKIAVPGGWATMGEIEEGMEVLIPDGGTAQVNGVFPRGKRDVYEVVTVDGARTQACDEHLWEVLIYD